MIRKIAVAATTVVALMAAPAAASAIQMGADQADNSYVFNWDAEKGEIANAASSTVITRGDKVTFYTYAFERPGAPQGKRLLGRVILRLASKKAVAYRGTFTYRVLDATGTAAFEKSKDRNVVLRPRKGDRVARLRFLYDLPSGDYTLESTFTKSG